MNEKPHRRIDRLRRCIHTSQGGKYIQTIGMPHADQLPK